MLDPQYARVAYLRPFHSWEPGKIGSADTRVIEVEWGLQVDNEKAHAKIADVQAT
jgi:DNA-directed RNA polymerase subunit F